MSEIKEEKKPREMPKGGRKGGSVFPRVPIDEAIKYARKLVSKTHVSAQPRDVIYSGVVGAGSGRGDIKISAIKQYGFMEGDSKSGYYASELARKISAAPPEDLLRLCQEAVLKPTIFKKIFDTFQGDCVSKAKLKQRAADLDVHPDEAIKCADIYAASMESAKLASINGDQVNHVSSVKPASEAPSSEEEANEEGLNDDLDQNNGASSSLGGSDDIDRVPSENKQTPPPSMASVVRQSISHSTPRAVFNVNVTLDSSLDISKLQRQLEILKQFGAI